MFNRIMFITGAILLSVVLSSNVCHAANMVKIGVLDLQKALNSTSEGLDAKKNLREKHEAKQKQIDAKKAELDSLEQRIKSPVLSQESKDELQKEYIKKRSELIEFVKSAKEVEDKEE